MFYYFIEENQLTPELAKQSYQFILQEESIQTRLLSIQIDKYKKIYVKFVYNLAHKIKGFYFLGTLSFFTFSEQLFAFFKHRFLIYRTKMCTENIFVQYLAQTLVVLRGGLMLPSPVGSLQACLGCKQVGRAQLFLLAPIKHLSSSDRRDLL